MHPDEVVCDFDAVYSVRYQNVCIEIGRIGVVTAAKQCHIDDRDTGDAVGGDFE
ncbi:hypothetical protein D3C81_2229480 [compost metagenome]